VGRCVAGSSLEVGRGCEGVGGHCCQVREP
jgi:hypothetical protein